MLRHALVVLFLAGFLSAQATTPEDAIVHFATAKSANELLELLPEASRKALLKAKPQAREQLLGGLLKWKTEEEGMQVDERLGDDLLTLRVKTDLLHIRVKKVVNDGMNAVVALGVEMETPKGARSMSMHGRMPSILVWSRYEDGGWRITGVAGGEGFDFEGKEFVDAIEGSAKAPTDAYEASAVGSLRTLNVAQVTYASTYGQGFAPSLQALGSAGAKDSGPCDVDRGRIG